MAGLTGGEAWWESRPGREARETRGTSHNTMQGRQGMTVQGKKTLGRKAGKV